MVFNDVIAKIGMTIDAAGVVVIVAGAVIAFVASAVGSPAVRAASTGVSGSGWARPFCSAWNCWWPPTSSAPSPPRPA
jgi:hypothetical protein